MVDIAHKNTTLRTAEASGRVLLNKEAFHLVKSNALKKGDVISVAKVFYKVAHERPKLKTSFILQIIILFLKGGKKRRRKKKKRDETNVK